MEIPPVERATAMQLCPQGAAAWRGNPHLPSRACKFSSALTAKAYGAAGQAASALHAMALLQVHQAKALKQLHEGGADPGVLQELRTATDLRRSSPPHRSRRRHFVTSCPGGLLLSPPHRRLQPLRLLVAEGALLSHVATCPSSPSLESEASEVALRRSCPRRSQSCSRRALMSARPSGRMVTPPRCTPADLEISGTLR